MVETFSDVDRVKRVLDSKVKTVCINDHVTEDIDTLKFNTAISAIMILTNALEEEKNITTEEYKMLLKILNPFAPHITEELWEQCKFQPQIEKVKWPTFKKEDLLKDEIEIVAQINSKIVCKLDVPTGIDNKAVEEFVKQNDRMKDLLNGKIIIKAIVVPNRLINFIVK